MTEPVARVLVWAVTLYLVLGAAFAVPFVIWGVGRIDPAAKTGTPGFKILIVPGVAALWPLLLMRLLSGRTSPPDQRTAHHPPRRSSR